MIKDTSVFIYSEYFQGIYYAIAWIKISQKVNRKRMRREETGIICNAALYESLVNISLYFQCISISI